MPTNVIEKGLVVKRLGENKYTTSIGSEFRFGEFVFGGFAATLIVHTALEHVKTTLSRSKEQHVTSFRVQFLAPIIRDEIVLRVEGLKVGKAMANLRVLLSQRGTNKVAGDVTIVDAATNRGLSIDRVFKLSPPATSVDLDKLERGLDPRWIKYHTPYSENSAVLALSHWDFNYEISGTQDPRIHDSWMRLHNPEERITNTILPIFTDMYLRMIHNFMPGSDFSHEATVRRAKRSINGSARQEDLDKTVMKVWSATQSLSLETVRQLPPEGVKWVFLRAEAKVLKDGKFVVEITVMDEAMNLVAIGQCVDFIIPSAGRVEGYRRTGEGARLFKV